jgi:hypothetical protein
MGAIVIKLLNTILMVFFGFFAFVAIAEAMQGNMGFALFYGVLSIASYAMNKMEPKS